MNLSDLSYAIRSFRRAPEFTVVALVTVALSISVTAVVFAHANTVLLRELPVHLDGSVVALRSVHPRRPSEPGVFSKYLDVLQAHRFATLDGPMAAVSPQNAILSVGDRVEQRSGERVNGSFFAFLRVRPLLGRLLLADDDRVDADRAVVISEPLWRSVFQASPSVVGRPVRLSGTTYTVVGVAPASFRGVIFANIVARDFWIPRNSREKSEDPRAFELESETMYALFARLKAGVSRRQAAVEVAAATALLNSQDDRLVTATPETVLTPPGVLRAGALVLIGLSLLVCAVGIGNVIVLMLARAEARAGEIGIRILNGASAGQLLRLVLTESALLTGVGGALGLAVAWAILRVWSSVDLPMKYEMLRYDAVPDAWFFGYGVLLMAVSAAVMGQKVGRQVAGLEPVQVLVAAAGGGGATRRTVTFGTRLLAGQVAFAAVVMTWAGLAAQYGRTAPLASASSRNVLVGRVNMGYRFPLDSAAALAAIGRTQEAVAATPGAVAWAMMNKIPTGDDERAGRWQPEGFEVGLFRGAPACETVVTSGDPFTVLGARVVHGGVRPFVSAASPSHVAVVSAKAADALWPGQNPIGRRLRQYSFGLQPPWLTVVAVVEDVRAASAWRNQTGTVYVRRGVGVGDGRHEFAILMRGVVGPKQLARSLRRTLGAMVPGTDVLDLRSLAEELDAPVNRVRSAVAGLMGLALVGVLLALLGVYAVVAYTVRLRRREIGIRLALGGRPARVWLVLARPVARATGLGIAGGLLLAALTAQLLLPQARLSVKHFDLVVFLAVPVLLAAAVGCACVLPSVSPMRQPPARVLQEP
jgi:predicted permease